MFDQNKKLLYFLEEITHLLLVQLLLKIIIFAFCRLHILNT